MIIRGQTITFADKWLAHTKHVQQEVFGYNFDTMTTVEKTEYLKNMVFAAEREIDEITREFSWKPWAHDEPFINAIRILAEVVDALHFLANILVSLGFTDQDLWKAYCAKAEINAERQLEGYLVAP